MKSSRFVAGLEAAIVLPISLWPYQRGKNPVEFEIGKGLGRKDAGAGADREIGRKPAGPWEQIGAEIRLAWGERALEQGRGRRWAALEMRICVFCRMGRDGVRIGETEIRLKRGQAGMKLIWN